MFALESTLIFYFPTHDFSPNKPKKINLEQGNFALTFKKSLSHIVQSPETKKKTKYIYNIYVICPNKMSRNKYTMLFFFFVVVVVVVVVLSMVFDWNRCRVLSSRLSFTNTPF